MKPLRIAGVPEHFNLPWHLLMASDNKGKPGLPLTWRDYADGTGAMLNALTADETDLAVVLTEGAVAAAENGRDVRIVSQFTESPLIWGIHVPADSAINSESGVRGRRYAISRPGSGSHLVSFAHARGQGWPLEQLQFVEVGTLQGAIDAFDEGRADVFFWEKFMTQPVVEAGRFRRVAEFVAPWPAFVICARSSVFEQRQVEIRAVIDQVCATAQRLSELPDAAALIAQRYGLEPGNVEEWLKLTQWSRGFGIDDDVPNRVAQILFGLGLVKERR